MKNVHSFRCHLLKRWNSSCLQWTAVWKLIRHCCTPIQSTDVCWIWFTVTLVYKNMQVATVTIDCIQLQQGIWVLAWVKWADFSALYIKVISCQAAYFVKSFNPFLTMGGMNTMVMLHSVHQGIYLFNFNFYSKFCYFMFLVIDFLSWISNYLQLSESSRQNKHSVYKTIKYWNHSKNMSTQISTFLTPLSPCLSLFKRCAFSYVMNVRFSAS